MVAQTLPLPNIKKFFIPDEGYVIADVDLDRADAQVVAWEADDDILKDAFRQGADVHQVNADDIGCTRKQAKAGVHATNYYVKAATLADTLGVSVADAQDFITKWFELHPGIKDWHHRIEARLKHTHTISNAFGYQRRFFDRYSEQLLREALAWIPQSTVAIIINQGMANIDEYLPWVDILLQVHDSLVIQFPKDKMDLRWRLKQEMLIEVPYDDPLVIPVSMQVSETSWGDCEDIAWS